MCLWHSLVIFTCFLTADEIIGSLISVVGVSGPDINTILDVTTAVTN